MQCKNSDTRTIKKRTKHTKTVVTTHASCNGSHAVPLHDAACNTTDLEIDKNCGENIVECAHVTGKYTIVVNYNLHESETTGIGNAHMPPDNDTQSGYELNSDNTSMLEHGTILHE